MSNQYTTSEAEDYPDSYYTNLPSLHINSLQSSQQTSPLSPDEMVIRTRGRRQFPSSFSPERLPITTSTSPKTSVVYSRHFPSPTRFKSPPKIAKPGPKTRTASRLSTSTERVRRQLDFPPDDQDFSILKLLPVIKKGISGPDQGHVSETEFLSSHSVKKLKISSSTNDPTTTSTTPSPLQLAKGLSKSQLVDLLCSLTSESPHLSARLSELLPKPDLSGLISHLTYLNQNIYKALPVTRLSDRTDSLAFNRVATHLAALKRSLIEDLNMLLEAGQWDSVLDFVLAAWDIVQTSPIWNNPVHNTTRVSCFKYLASSVIRVMKQKDIVLGEERRMKLVKLMTGSQLREVQLCKEQLLGKRK